MKNLIIEFFKQPYLLDYRHLANDIVCTGIIFT